MFMCFSVAPYNPQQQYVPGQYGGPPQPYHQQAGMSTQGYSQPLMSMPQQQQPNYMNAGNQMGLYPGYQQPQQQMSDQYSGYQQQVPPPQQQMRMMGPGQAGGVQMPAAGAPQMMGPGQMAGMPIQPGASQHMAAPGGGMMPAASGPQGGQMRPPPPAGSMSNPMPPSGQMPMGQYSNYGQQGQF